MILTCDPRHSSPFPARPGALNHTELFRPLLSRVNEEYCTLPPGPGPGHRLLEGSVRRAVLCVLRAFGGCVLCVLLVCVVYFFFINLMPLLSVAGFLYCKILRFTAAKHGETW